MANSLMFEVGVRDANDSIEALQKQLQEITTKYGKLELKVQVDGLERFIEGLKMIGSGKPIEELQKRFDVLQVTLANAGMTGAKSMQEFEAALKVASATADSYRKRIEEMTATRDKFSRDSKGWVGANALLQNFQNDKQVLAIFAQEEVAIKNLADAKERLAKTSDGTEKTKQDVNAVRGDVDALVTSINNFVTALKSIGQSNGLKDVDTAMKDVDKNTQKAAEKLATTFKNLSDEKNKTVQSETNLATETQKATGQLVAEEEQAKRTALAMQEAAVAINNAALAARSLTITMGGNSQDVNKFIELSSKMDVINKQANELLTNKNIPFGEKQGLMAGYKQELEAITKEMDTLKSEAATTNPLIETFSAAFKSLSAALTSASEAIGSAASNLKTLETNLGNAVKKTDGLKSIETAAKDGSKAVVEESQKIKELKGQILELEGNKKGMLNSLYMGDAKKQAHDILEVANTLYKIISKTNTPFNGKEKLFSVGAEEPILALAKAYSITREEAVKLIRSIQESDMVQKKFSMSFDDKMGLWNISMQKRKDLAKDAFGYNNQSDWEIRLEKAKKLLDIEQNLEARRNKKSESAATDKEVSSMSELQRIIKGLEVEINKVLELFTKLGNADLLKPIQTAVNNLKDTLSSLGGALKFKGNEAEIEAYNKRIDELKNNISSLETKLKNLKTATEQAEAGIKTVASGKGSEAIQNTNLDTVKAQMDKVSKALQAMEAEYKRMEEAGAQNVGLQSRIEMLRQYYDWLQKVVQMDLSKAGSLKATDLMFNGNLLFGQVNKQMYSDKAVKEFGKIVDETIKAKGAADSLNEAFERMKQKMLGIGTSAEGGMRGVATQMESINRVGEANIQTLIREKGHIERLIAMAEQSVKVAKGNPVAGMFGLENQQRENLVYLKNVKEMIDHILTNRNAPEWMRFLNTPNSLRLPLSGSDNDIALLGAHFNILTHNVTGTTTAIRNLRNEMRLDDNFATFKQWNTTNLERGLYNVNDAIRNVMKAWRDAKEYADEGMMKSVAQEINRLNAIKSNILSAMTNDDLLRTRNGYASVITPSTNHELKEAKELVTQLNAVKRDGVKADKEYNKEVERFTEQSKKAYAQAEKEKEKAAKERASAVAAAEKQVQTEITKTESLQKKVEQSITRGEAAKRDMSGLYAQNAALEQQVRLMEALKNSINRGNIDPNSDIIGRRIKDTQVLREDTELLRKAEEKLNQAREQANKRNDNAAIKKLQDEEKSVKQAWNRYEELKVKIAEVEALRQRAQELKMDTSSIDSVLQKYKILKAYMENIFNNGGRSTVDYGRATRGMLTGEFWEAQGKATNTQLNASLKSFNQELTETERQSKSADSNIRKLGMAFNELKNYMKQNGGSEEMKRLQTEIQGAIQKMRQLMNAGDYKGAVNVYERITGLLRQASTATREFDNSQHNLASTVSKTNSNLQGQSQVLSDLKTMAMQYLSVWGAQSFIHNIIDLGGQLEQQRLSIGAILQDTAQANYLFGQIKDLAIRSPFGVQQLDAMTKQLSAYGFQYSELYEWTKRLADISAATGTSVDRLALALGHVRSEGALSGYTLRQFSMGNIPLLQKLSENLGKTKQEIRKMTRNKEIGYEDVLEVLKQLTDESGMFYQAQETMSQALNAKFKNLKDSFQIMYSEMAEGAPGDFLKGVATVLTDISKSWRVLMPIILSGAGALGVWKLATMALNHTLERTSLGLTQNAIATSKYSMAQLRAIHTTGRWTLALRGLGHALMSVGKFVFNPVTLGFAAVEGLIYLWSRHNDEVRKAKDLTKAYGDAAVESEKNIAKQLEKIKPFSATMDESTLKTGIDSMTESIKNYANNGQSIINSMFDKDSEGRVMSLAEKYQYLREELEKTAKMYKELKRVKDAFEYGITESDNGWFDDNVETDLTQYAEAYKKFVDDVTSYNTQYGNSIENAIKAAEKADPAFAKVTANLTSYGEKLAAFWSNPEKYQNAAQIMNGLFGSGAGSNDAMSLNESFFGYLNKKKDAMNELDQFIANTEQRLKEKGYDFSKELAPEQVGALLKMSKEWLEKHPEWENIYDEIKSKLEGRWPIKIVPDAEAVPEQLSGWQQEIQDWLDDNGLKIQISPTDSHEDFIKKVKSLHEAAQTAMDNSGKVLIGIGFKLDNLPSELPNALATPWNQSNLDTYNDKKSTIDKIEQLKKKFNVSWKEKGGNKGSKKNPDTERAKAVREQVRVIKEAADAFQYWRDKVGDKAAWEHVQSEFGDILAKIGITADNIEDVRGRLREIPKMKEYKAIKDKKVKTEIDKEIAKEEDQYKRKDFERETEKFLSETEIKLDSLTRAWEKFNTVREATGNLSLAINIAGVKYQEGQRTLADAVRQSVEDDFKSFGVQAIPFSVELDKESIKRQIQEAFAAVAPIKPVQGKDESAEDFKQRMDAYNAALATHEARIKGVVTEYEKWQELEKQVQQNDLQVYSNLVGSTVDLATQLQKVNDEYRKEIESLERLKKLGVENGGISNTEFDRASRISTSNYEMKRVQAQKEYQFLMDGVITMNKEAAKTIRNEYVEALKGKLRAGTITAKEYADKIEEINDKMRELEHQQSDGMAYWGGGTDGLINNMKKRAKAQEEAGAAEIQQGQKLMDLADSLGNAEMFMKGFSQMQSGQKMAAAGQGLSEFAGGMSETMAYVDIIVHGINDIVQGFKALIDEIDEMDQALGNGSLKESGDDVYTFIDSFSRASNKATQAFDSFKNGDMMGMMAGIVGSFTQWVTGFAQGHDRKRDHEIKVAEEQLKIVKNIDSRLETQLSRTLGGGTTATIDRATLMRYAPMSDLWNQMQAGDTKAWVQYLHSYSGMQMQRLSGSTLDAIRTAAQNESVYSAQLASLMEQRDLISQQLAAESDKKNSDNTAIDEYEQQIAELNDKIKYFVEDTGKELYGLDLKGWASQIGDALMTAFENGEDAMEAFRDTAKDIMRDVASEMLKLGVLEPMMENLRQELFGKEWTDSNGNVWRGVYNQTTGRFDETQTLSVLDKYFGEGGEMEKAVGAGQEFYDWVQKITGEDLRSSDSSSSMSNTIKGVTEQTADLLCSYVSAIRLDVSVNRAAIAQYFPLFYQTLTSQNGSLVNIENHTAAIMRSNDAIERSNQAILDSINGLKNKAWKVPIS